MSCSCLVSSSGEGFYRSFTVLSNRSEKYWLRCTADSPSIVESPTDMMLVVSCIISSLYILFESISYLLEGFDLPAQVISGKMNLVLITSRNHLDKWMPFQKRLKFWHEKLTAALHPTLNGVSDDEDLAIVSSSLHHLNLPSLTIVLLAFQVPAWLA